MRRLSFAAMVCATALLGGCGTTGSGGSNTPAAEVDTGRLSDGELGHLEIVLGMFDDEAEDFTGGIQRCATIASAGQLAESVTCWDDAYAGLEDDAGYAYSVLDGLRADTRGRCRRTVARLADALDRFTTSMQQMHELGANLSSDIASAREVSTRLRADSLRYLMWSSRLYDRCSPT